MRGGAKRRREYYLEQIKAAEEAAAKATGGEAVPEAAQRWKQVASGYRQLLARLADQAEAPER